LKHPAQLALSVLGVALGVAVVVALDLAIQSSRAAFEASTTTVAGRATHMVIGGPTGVDAAVFRRIRLEIGLREAAPVIEGFVTTAAVPGITLRLLGVDPFSEAAFRPYLGGGPSDGRVGTLLTTEGGVFLSAETAASSGLGVGDTFSLETNRGPRPVVLAGLLEPVDAFDRVGVRDLAITDIGLAEDLVGRPGGLSRVDLAVPAGDAGNALLERIRAILPPDARLEEAGTRTRTLEGMIGAFDLNLTALSLLALVFGMFLIYNTMTFSVVQRRNLIGSLRAIGVTRGEIFRGIAVEAALLGAVGTAFGIGLGIVLGRGLVRLITRTINDLYFVLNVEGLAVSPGVIVKGAVIGVTATVLTALPPAWEASGANPRQALLRSALEGTARRWVPKAAISGLMLAALALPILLLSGESLIVSFLAIFLVILSLALLTPLGTVLLVATVAPLLRRAGGTLWAIAARSVVTSLSRTGPAIAALVVAVSVVVGLGSMITSFRSTLIGWLDQTLQADIYVSLPSTVSSRPEGTLPPGVVDVLTSAPEVAGFSTYRGTEFQTDYGLTRLVALDLDPRGEAAFTFQAGRPREAFASFRDGEGLLVSEPFAYRHRLSVGDDVRLPTVSGERSFAVSGVFFDYGSERGTLMIARDTYDRYFDDPEITSLGLFLSTDSDSEATVVALGRRLADAGLADVPVIVRSNRALRDTSLRVFDRTFAVTGVLRALAFVVAFIGVLSALMAIQLERSRELGLLRATGLTPRELWKVVTAETGILGFVAGIQAIPIGVALAAIMIFIVNKRSFGWTLQMEVPFALLAQSVGLALLGALLAGLYPAWRMARVSPAEALRDE
jgi:putative ABC transport system permease protein